MHCKYCDEDKPATSFEVANVINGKSYLRKKCKRCKQLQQNGRRYGIGQWLKKLKQTLSCTHCGHKDFRVLEFHHLGDKDFDIGYYKSTGASKARIEAEIKKCIPLCANCHRIVHYEEQQLATNPDKQKLIYL